MCQNIHSLPGQLHAYIHKCFYFFITYHMSAALWKDPHLQHAGETDMFMQCYEVNKPAACV